MGSNPAALQSSPKLKIAKAIAGGLPSELSQSPLLGILGVVLGAGIVTLTGRMLTLGLADLKGSLGMGFDDGAWLGTAFNVSLMFIGPFTVYIGGLLGPRRVLLAAAVLFTLICAFLPLIHSYSLLVSALVLAGLASGTFYPLTLSFALRNIPLRFLPFTLALYATSVDGAVNIAPSLYGWYREHLSFHWMFWNSALITPVMIACIYYGIPPAAPPKRTGPAPSFAGFLYASAGFAMLFAALDQGQRLDWWNSAIFNALFFGGAIFLLASLIRRLRMPNPLVDLPYLRQWNTLLLGVSLTFFRFCLLATIILIPQSLSIHGFEANQIAPAVFLDRSASTSHRRHRRTPSPARIRFAALDGCWFYVHGRSIVAQLPIHSRMVRLELLPFGTFNGGRPILCIHRVGLDDRPPGCFHGRALQTTGGVDLLRLFSHRPTLRWPTGSCVHDAFHRCPGTTALQPDRSPCPARQLDRRRCTHAARRGSVREIFRTNRRNGPRRRAHRRPCSIAGVHPDLYRWISSCSLGLRRGSAVDRLASTISIELPGTQLPR